MIDYMHMVVSLNTLLKQRQSPTQALFYVFLYLFVTVPPPTPMTSLYTNTRTPILRRHQVLLRPSDRQGRRARPRARLQEVGGREGRLEDLRARRPPGRRHSPTQALFFDVCVAPTPQTYPTLPKDSSPIEIDSPNLDWV